MSRNITFCGGLRYIWVSWAQYSCDSNKAKLYMEMSLYFEVHTTDTVKIRYKQRVTICWWKSMLFNVGSGKLAVVTSTKCHCVWGEGWGRWAQTSVWTLITNFRAWDLWNRNVYLIPTCSRDRRKTLARFCLIVVNNLFTLYTNYVYNFNADLCWYYIFRAVDNNLLSLAARLLFLSGLAGSLKHGQRAEDGN